MEVGYILSVENKQLYNIDVYKFAFQKWLNNIIPIFKDGRWLCLKRRYVYILFE